MSERVGDHDRIEEILAAYALRALSSEDAAEADRLLSQHVPTCAQCRTTLQDFLAVESELGLAAAPAEPPDLLLPRLKQSVAARPAPRGRRSILGWSAAVAAAAVVGLVSWNAVALDHRVSRLQDRAQGVGEAITVAADPLSKRVSLDNRRVPPATRLIAAYVPGREEMSVMGTGVPDPDPGAVYRVWLIASDGHSTLVGEFLPEDGIVALGIHVDLTGYNALVITEEEGEPSSGPVGPTRWFTTL